MVVLPDPFLLTQQRQVEYLEGKKGKNNQHQHPNNIHATKNICNIDGDAFSEHRLII